jgi:hypothetical protein
MTLGGGGEENDGQIRKRVSSVPNTENKTLSLL